MSAFAVLAQELDRWHAAGLTTDFWWRDDDAVARTDALDRLLTLRATLGVPLAIAAVPARCADSLADAVAGAGSGDVAMLQHGWAHRNHAPDGGRKIELGGARPVWDIARELADGRARMLALFPRSLLAALVPPWNRIDAAVVPLLPGLGYDALSAWGARDAAEAAPGLAAINVHVDIVDWPGTRRFVGDDAAIGQAVAHLAAKRTGAADRGEPTGLMTHHLAHDAGCWDFVERFVAATAAHPAVRWLHPRALFPGTTDAMAGA